MTESFTRDDKGFTVIEDNLKNCPFCGGKSELKRTRDNAQWWYGECTKSPCYARQLASPTAKEAADMWDRRATTPLIGGS